MKQLNDNYYNSPDFFEYTAGNCFGEAVVEWKLGEPHDGSLICQFPTHGTYYVHEHDESDRYLSLHLGVQDGNQGYWLPLAIGYPIDFKPEFPLF